MDLPQEFCERMERLLGSDASAFLDALTLPPSRALRFDENKVTLEELKAAFGDALGEAIPFLPNAFRFEGEGIGTHPYHHGGALYVQEPAAMAPVSAAMGKKARKILDLCAAPGGKSLQAAALLLEKDGLLVCNEPEGKRRKALMQNLERFGEKRCQVTGFDARRLPENWTGVFDLVICDAPCSGEGMMRKHEAAWAEWSMENVLLCAERQKDILSEAARALAPGGRLLYSTCTWAVEENEEVVADFLASHPDFRLVPPTEAVRCISADGVAVSGCNAPLSLTRRFYPHLFRGEGQFLALMEKAEGGETEPKRKDKSKNKKGKEKKPSEHERIAKEFLLSVLEGIPEEALLFRGDDCFLIPKEGLKESDTVSPGVLMGTVQKGRLVPHHRFFLAFAESFQQKIRLAPDDPRIEAYLRGEEIPAEGKGYAVLFAGKCPLGGLKISCGQGKNLYPKGIRKV